MPVQQWQDDDDQRDFDDPPDTPCTYCGKLLHGGAVQCPKCRNYTDGQGPLRGGEQPTGAFGRPIPRVFVIAGWIVLLVLLVPLLLALLKALGIPL